MKQKTFFKKFDEFAALPNAVAKMRELVLQLAVTGKLVVQDKRDPPASSLLDSARAERAELVAVQSIKPRPSVKIEASEQPFKLPIGWAWARLSDVGHELGQKVPDSRFTYIDVGSVDSERGCISARVKILDPYEAPSRARKLVAPGTVIYSTVRPYLRNVAIIDQNFDPEPIASTAFGILHPFACINNCYLFYWLRSGPFTSYVQSVMKGMAYPAINDEQFYSGFIALPPLSEQKRIVAKVVELMTLCDQLEAQQEEREKRRVGLARASLARFAKVPSPANLELLFHPSCSISPADLRKSILTLAVQGKLVIQNPHDETAKDCLSRLGLNNTHSPAIGSDPQSGSLPPSWARVRFEDIALVAGGVTLGRKLDTGKTVTLPYLRVANVKRGHLDLSVVKEVSIAETEIERYALLENDLLLTEGGDWDKVGRAAIWRSEIPICLHQNHVFRARMRSDEIVPFWFERYFNSPAGRGYFELASKQTTNLASINMRQVRGCPVPFPPLAEQRRIMAKVDQLMGLVDRQEAQLADSHNVATNLLEAAVTELTGVERMFVQNQSLQHTTFMKPKVHRPMGHRERVEPLKISTRSFVLRRFKMASGYRSLGEFDCTYHTEDAGPNEASPICLVGLNGSGKSNLIEAMAEVFCFLELINLPWKKVASPSSRYRENRHQFELEYILKDDRGERLIRIRKIKKNGAEFFIVKKDNTEQPVESEKERLLLLPRRIIGYSSGLNETVSHPFLRTKTIYSEEVRDAAPPESVVPMDDTVFDTRTLYMDYESNAAILISNYIFRKTSELAFIEKFTRVRAISSFGLHFNRKRAGRSGLHKVVRLTSELHSYLKSFAQCAGIKYDKSQIVYDLKFQLTSKTRTLFRREFKTAQNLFMAMHKWSLLNALVLSDEQRNVYLRSDITKGALERPPSVPPSDRVFNIVDLKLNLSTPAIEIDYSGLSDGEHQFVQVFGTALLFSEPGTLFLFDEPESHFNPEWRTKFNLILNGLPHASRQEYIISTHSPYIVSGSRQSNVYKFVRNGANITCDHVDFETYGASFDALLKRLFSIDSFIDLSAKKELEQIIKRGKVKEMRTAVGEFAESKEKRRLYEAIIRKERAK